MYNVVLVDDDLSSIKILSEIFPWSKFGYELAGVFSSAEKAFELMKHRDIDLLITDISMPGITGLELVKMCAEEFPAVKIILISAYRNFEYAQIAVSYKNVVNYITKPIDFQNFQNTLSKLCDDLNSEKHTKLDVKCSERIEFFSNLICGYIKSNDDIYNGLIKLNIDTAVMENKCCSIYFHIKDFHNYMQSVWKYSNIQLYNAIGNMFPIEDEYAYYSISNYSFGNFSWLIILKDNSYFYYVIENFVCKLSDNMKSLLKMNIEEISQNTFKSLYDVINIPISNEFNDNDSETAINAALEYINANYMKNISLSDVAEHVFMAPAYFSVFFKKQTGTNFIKYLTNIRLEYAKHLLETSDMMVSEICSAVGYNHIGNFLDKFKKKYNLTPNEYRKIHITTNKD